MAVMCSPCNRSALTRSSSRWSKWATSMGGRRGRFEDRPVVEVVAVLGEVGDPVPSAGAAVAVVEDGARDLLGECSRRSEPDRSCVEVADAVVDQARSKETTELGERFVVTELDVRAGERAGTDAAGFDPFRGHLTTRGRFLLVLVAADDGVVLGDDRGVGPEVGEA